MKRINLVVFFLGLSLSTVYAQKDVLFTIDENPYYTDEFIRIYKKNLDLVKDDSQKDLDVYLDLFMGYKLKVSKAYKLGLDKNQKYINELSSYRNQLSKNYMSDSKVTKKLVDEAYQRSLQEVNASHILLLVDENAPATDTLKAYNQLLDVKKEIEKGSITFEEAAKKYSQDPSAVDNGGNLGFFSVFRMVYPFESAAFQTPKGKISMPVRTRFGFHLIQVNDTRPNRGEVTVAHIMINEKTDQKDAALSAKATIEDIYKKFQQGETFESLATQYSDDKSSAPKGGVLQRFGSGQLSSEEFESVAFSLEKSGDVSQPFQTQFGWHIVKLIQKHPVKTYDEAKQELENRIKRDERSKVVTDSLLIRLYKKYKVVTDAKLVDKVKKSLNDTYYDTEWKTTDALNALSGDLLKINQQPIPVSTFVSYIEDQHKQSQNIKPVSVLVTKLLSSFKDKEILNYYDNQLETEFPEFKYIMDEYREGLLLFDLMEKEIWERSKNDSIGQLAFYEKNKNQYLWKKRFKCDLFSSVDEKEIKKAYKLVSKNKIVEEIKKELNSNDKVNIMIQSGTFEENDKVLPKTLSYSKGISKIVKEGNYFFFINIHEILPAGIKTLDEAKGRVINDYQQSLEANWVNELKKEATIKVNKDVLEKVKKQLQN